MTTVSELGHMKAVPTPMEKDAIERLQRTIYDIACDVPGDYRWNHNDLAAFARAIALVAVTAMQGSRENPVDSVEVIFDGVAT